MLNRSKVIFDPESHTYMLYGKELSGITSMLTRQLFADKYSGVPAGVLEAAADRGHLIHTQIELIDSLGVEATTEEGKIYQRLKEENEITILENEYLVSDEDSYATSIDAVTADYSIIDFKTTSHLDEGYLRWQLSVGAYLFEKQNPSLKANKLLGMWIRGEKSKVIELERIPSEVIISLLEADKKGEQFSNPYTVALYRSEELTKVAEIERFIIDLNSQIDIYKKQKDSLLEVLEQEMEKASVKEWKTDKVKITRVLPSETTTFDSKKLQQDSPDTYAKYIRKSQRKGYVKITLL